MRGEQAGAGAREREAQASSRVCPHEHERVRLTGRGSFEAKGPKGKRGGKVGSWLGRGLRARGEGEPCSRLDHSCCRLPPAPGPSPPPPPPLPRLLGHVSSAPLPRCTPSTLSAHDTPPTRATHRLCRLRRLGRRRPRARRAKMEDAPRYASPAALGGSSAGAVCRRDAGRGSWTGTAGTGAVTRAGTGGSDLSTLAPPSSPWPPSADPPPPLLCPQQHEVVLCQPCHRAAEDHRDR